jgi:glycosyltransferase involved in cell wall biosynthesis
MAFVYDIPVLQLVNRFWIGGAERQFVERLRLHPEGFSALVGCLEPSGPMLAQVRALGHEPVVFPLKGSMLQANTAVQVARMVALIREHRVRIVHTTDFNDGLVAAGLREPLPDGPLVAVIGNLWPVKGHRTLLEAVALLPSDLHQVRFICAGEGPERTPLSARIAELGLRERVILVGHRLDVPALLTRSQAACLCSSAEGLSNALMEAMAARLPVIATRVGGNPELVHEGENGWLVPYGDARALADRLTRLLRSPDEAREMGRKGRERVEKELTLERMAAGYGALYRRMLGRAPLVREEQASRAA